MIFLLQSIIYHNINFMLGIDDIIFSIFYIRIYLNFIEMLYKNKVYI